MKIKSILATLVAALLPGVALGNAVPAPPPMICLDEAGCDGHSRGNNLEAVSARFIGRGGNDSYDGRTHATRWATTAPARGLSQGTHVYIQAGHDQGPRAWRIDWGGSESSPVVIGCYYLDPAYDNQATSCDAGSLRQTLQRPILRGTYSSECRKALPSSCPVDTSGAIPSSKWNGLVDVHASHVIVQDLEVKDSSGPGIRHAAGFVHSNMTVQRVRVYQTFGTGVWFNKAVRGSNVVVRDSHVELTALQRVDGRESNWSGAIVINSDGLEAHARVENNFVRDSGGEGIVALRVSQVIIAGNTVANNRRPLIYLDNASDVLVEHNMLLGNGYMNGLDDSFGVALGVVVESYGQQYDSIRNVFRHNLVANTKGAMHLSVHTGCTYNCSPDRGDPAAEGFMVGLRAYGNTILQDKRAFLIGNNLAINNNVDQIEIYKNILVGDTNCSWPELDSAVARISDNVYENRPNDAVCLGAAYDIKDPRIPLNYKSINADNIPEREEFLPR